jgi:colicin import membrane protein
MKKGRNPLRTDRKFYLWLATAAGMHFFVLFLSVLLLMWDAGRHMRTRVVNVTFVSLPGSGGPAGGAMAPVREQAADNAATEQKPAQDTRPVEQVAEPTRKKVPEEPRKTTPTDLSRAMERLKQDVGSKEPASPSSINKTLSALRDKVNAQVSAGSGQGGGSGRGGAGMGSGSGGSADPYKAQLAMIIQENWEFSKHMMRSSYGMEVYVRINILPDGTIREIVYDRRARSEYLNMSVKKALEKSSPLPGLPKGQGNPDLWIGFVFTPEGIEK